MPVMEPPPSSTVDQSSSQPDKLQLQDQDADLNQHQRDKIGRIHAACSDADILSLATLATEEGGLITDHARRMAWPILIGTGSRKPSDRVSWSSLPPHKDEGQVGLDVDRSFTYYPDRDSEKRLQQRRQDLSDLIVQVLREHPSLGYFQGYHDIVQVLLLVLGPAGASVVVDRLSILRLRDFMLPSLSASLSHLHLLPALLKAADPSLQRHLSDIQPFFALASVLTLYAHDIQEYGDIARLFDFLLAQEAVLSVYLFAVTILVRKRELLEIPSDEPDMLHFILSKLPKPLDLEHLIDQAMQLYRSHPPESLPDRAWHRISSFSVLKTTRNSQELALQPLAQGMAFFHKQEVQMLRQQRVDRTVRILRMGVRRYGRRAAAVTVAVVVGFAALWLGRRDGALARYYAAPLSRTLALFRGL